MRDQCDVRLIIPSQSEEDSDGGDIPCPCPNGMNSSARLKRCSRGEIEPGYTRNMEHCHNGNKNYLVCSTCEHSFRNYPDFRHAERRIIRMTHWRVCAVCTKAQERQYPNGALFCTCIKRNVFCWECYLAR